VVSIGNSDDEVTIRFFTDNPGPWFLHCHIDWHLNMLVTLLYARCWRFSSQRCYSGFAVVFAEDVPDIPSNDVVTRELL
jgi:iron transport multicopper oxidase